ncbi:hypothetical protein [Streptomyces sp. NPDC050988]|uniref:hypothetical protein n=1 Tax=Streptomyces sp. NPDC050988 TaxID=3365637 RepID=UPI0037952C95
MRTLRLSTTAEMMTVSRERPSWPPGSTSGGVDPLRFTSNFTRSGLKGLQISGHYPCVRRFDGHGRKKAIMRVSAFVLAVGLALPLFGATPSASAAEPSLPHSSRSVAAAPLACAPIIRKKYNPYLDFWWATVQNDCGRNIYASVQVDYNPDPPCAWIANGETHRFGWGGLPTAKPNYAYEC